MDDEVARGFGGDKADGEKGKRIREGGERKRTTRIAERDGMGWDEMDCALDMVMLGRGKRRWIPG